MCTRTTRTNRPPRFTVAARVIGFAVGIVAVGAPGLAQLINEDLKLMPSDAAIDDQFGRSIATSAGVVGVGSWYDDDNGPYSGSAYLFDAATGAELRKLITDDGAFGHSFGVSIAIDQGIVAVGAHDDDVNGLQSGSAYLFDAATGAQLFKLVPDDGAIQDWFGRALGIDDGVVAVGAYKNDELGLDAGAVYLFNASTGAQLFKLLPTDGVTSDSFGYSVAIDSGIVAIGAPEDDDNGSLSGSAYLFNATTGAQITKLLPTDGEPNERFGWSIDIDNGIVAVGAVIDDDNGPQSGSVYLFDASTGLQTGKLLADDGVSGDQFGFSIAINTGVVAVGSHYDADNGSNSGSAYLFDASTGGQIAKFLPTDGAEWDEFGHCIAIDSGVVSVGAWYDDDNGSKSGSAYVAAVPESGCPADMNGDGIADLGDITTFVALFLAFDTAADLNGDGIIDLGDINAFIALFLAGC